MCQARPFFILNLEFCMSFDSVMVRGLFAAMDPESGREVAEFLRLVGDDPGVWAALFAFKCVHGAGGEDMPGRSLEAAVRLFSQCSDDELVRAMEVLASDEYAAWFEGSRSACASFASFEFSKGARVPS